jgi:hypothetical protein
VLDDKIQVRRGVVVDTPFGWESPSVRRESEMTEMAEMQVAHRAESRMENDSRIIINLLERALQNSRVPGGKS